MRSHRIAFFATTLFAFALTLALAAPALGIPDIYEPQWATTGSGFSHKSAMSQAMSIAAGRGANWVESIAVDRAIYPDTVFRDNIDHNYNHFGGASSYYNSSWGSDFGNPQGKVQSNYNAVVAALKRGDKTSASIYMGYLSHYLIDINGPLHTQESATENSALHTNLEAAASSASMSGYIHDDGYRHYGGYSSPSALTVANATSAHAYYSSLVSNYHDHGFNGTVHDIEGTNFNRGVNSIADLIESAQNDVEAVGAVIDSTTTTSTVGQSVHFAGRGGCTVNHAIVNYQWRSSVSGVLSNAASFDTTSLPVGVHAIYFKAQCSSGKWSPEVMTTFVVGAENTVPRPVYRFLNRKTGVHFYTANETEKRGVISGGASTYSFEGVAYALDASSTVNIDPLYRFLVIKRGVHFYTASPVERDNVLAVPPGTYNFEGTAFNVSVSPTDTLPVWRFYNKKNGTHFYTANVSEKNTVMATGLATYNPEGPAWYYVPPWPFTL